MSEAKIQYSSVEGSTMLYVCGNITAVYNFISIKPGVAKLSWKELNLCTEKSPEKMQSDSLRCF